MSARFAQDGNEISISAFCHHAEEARSGNPYNTTFWMHVVSDDFSGAGEWECDIRALGVFAEELEELYRFRRSQVTFLDIGYGSRLRFTAADRTGHIQVDGTLFGSARVHSLTFEFLADQTTLGRFVQELRKLLPR